MIANFVGKIIFYGCQFGTLEFLYDLVAFIGILY